MHNTPRDLKHMLCCVARLEGPRMRRREFFALSVGAAVSWPWAARAQRPSGVRRVAFLLPFLENVAEAMSRVTAFREGLEALGWSENRNIRI